jgi:1-acylglycerone phosphate reductase
MAPPKQKTVLITGCSAGGIGDALAQELHAHNYKVYATARSLSKMTHLSAMGIETLTLDVTSSASIASAVAHVTNATSGTLDMLINNSGSGYNGITVLDTDIPTAKAMFDVNVFGVLAVTQSFAPLLIKSKGTIALISSIAAFLAGPLSALYSASKAAAQAMSDSLRIEMAPLDVSVISVVTAGVASKFWDNNAPKVEIPDKSVYAAGKAEFTQAASGVNVPDPMAPDVFARQVVKDLVKEKPKARVWRGGEALQCWLAATFLWTTFPDGIMSKVSGFEGIAKAVRR